MVDAKSDLLQQDEEEKQPNPWPSREGKVSELEESLHNVLDWGIIANLRGKFDYPSMILEKTQEELAEENIMPETAIDEVLGIIREWDKDPDSYVNPKGGNGEIYFKKAPVPAKPETEILVKEY